MRPLDPRLLRFARSTRAFMVLVVVLGTATAALVIVQARLISAVIVSVVEDGAAWSDVSRSVVAIACVFCGRAALSWLGEMAAFRSSARAKAELREAVVAHVMSLGPAAPTAVSPGGTAALLTRGADALDGYFARYLPQLALSVIVPVAVLMTVLSQDLVSGLVIAVTLPLIPVFMVLIGRYTRARVDRQWRTLGQLTGHFLDLVSGLPTLTIFGRARAQVDSIEEVGERYRSTTMGVLRVTFLSSFALELIATLSVALVAVSVGLRLDEGRIAFSVALFVLLLVPEAYLPLRLVGQHFHAAAEGLGAAERMFDILQAPLPARGTRLLASGPVTVDVSNLSARYLGSTLPALEGATFIARPGTVTAVIGPSGGGKSTLLSCLLGFVEPESGTVRVQASEQVIELRELDAQDWRARVAWLPQHARLLGPQVGVPPTVLDAVLMGRRDATEAQAWQALADAGVADEVRALPDGLATRLSPDGSGLSAGQVQRIAIARTLIAGADVILLDEPTSSLDPASEDRIVAAIRLMAARGATVIVVAHRPSVVELAHQVVRVERRADGDPSPAVGDAIAGVGW